MTKNRNTSGLRPPWKKGESGNKGGSRPLPDVLKKSKLHTIDEIKRTISLYFRMDKEAIIAILDNPKVPSLDLIIASTIAKAIEHGDIHRAEYLFTRLVGRVTEKIEVQHPEPVMIQRASGEVIEVGVQDAEVEEGE